MSAWYIVEAGWHYREGVGSVRKMAGRGGWWFLPEWLPDSAEHDVGPFSRVVDAKIRANVLFDEHAEKEPQR